MVGVLAFAACSDDDEPAVAPKPLPEKGDIALQGATSHTDVPTGETGGVQIISFTAPDAWKVSLSHVTRFENWVELNPTQGAKGANRVEMRIAPNTTAEERIVKVEFSAGDAWRHLLVVKQAGVKQPEPEPEKLAVRYVDELICEVHEDPVWTITYKFSYDAQNRITKMESVNPYYGDFSFTFTYNGDKVTISDGGSVNFILGENNHISRFQFAPELFCDLSYTPENYLLKGEMFYYFEDPATGVVPHEHAIYDFVYAGNELQSLRFVMEMANDGYNLDPDAGETIITNDMTCTFTPDMQVENSTNLNLAMWCIDPVLHWLRPTEMLLTGFCGRGVDHLFKEFKVVEHHDQLGDYSFSELFTYKLDAQGYVEQIDTKPSNADQGMAPRTLKIKYRK